MPTDDNALEKDSPRKRSILRNDDWKKVANETKFWIPLNLSNFIHKGFKVMLHGTIRNDDFYAQHSVATLLRHCFE